ncbi:MAG: tRNA lysidine(34) synthetase TilS [Pseudomonadota bacterium]|nr:tRNA lysidine(34) synthetase TilS [Pseudomonadota bacterium]
MIPAAEAVARFAADLNVLLDPGERLGVAVSGGPDSLALLLLAAAARPGQVSAASVDHGLREGSRGEAEMVARLCADIGVAHEILTIDWLRTPTSALQEQARDARYAALGRWAEAQGLSAVATGHHADDQAETLMMRLLRGAGVRGLAAMRPSSPLRGNMKLKLVRPLLGWRRAKLASIVAAAGVTAVSDPSNGDEQHERVRIRRLLAASEWIDPAALAASARYLGAADKAIEYAVAREYGRVQSEGEELCFDPGDTPTELRRRVVARIIATLASEGDGAALRGGELDRLLAQIEGGASATLRGVVAEGGPIWRFRRAPPRR